MHLDQSVDEQGQIVDPLSGTRDISAARAFLRKAQSMLSFEPSASRSCSLKPIRLPHLPYRYFTGGGLSGTD
jgi:hypothetical protein